MVYGRYFSETFGVTLNGENSSSWTQCEPLRSLGKVSKNRQSWGRISTYNNNETGKQLSLVVGVDKRSGRGLMRLPITNDFSLVYLVPATQIPGTILKRNDGA